MANQYSGTKIDGSKVRFWATKPEAVTAARAIGWPANSVSRVHTRFQLGWALGKGAIGGWLSREEYGALHADRNGAQIADGKAELQITAAAGGNYFADVALDSVALQWFAAEKAQNLTPAEKTHCLRIADDVVRGGRDFA